MSISFLDVITAIAVFWAFGLITWYMYENYTAKKVVNDFSPALHSIYEKYERLLARVEIIERDHFTITKLADETKKLLNTNNMATAFVSRNKRAEGTM